MTRHALHVIAGLALGAILLSPSPVRADEPVSSAPAAVGPLYYPPTYERWLSAGAPLAPRRSEPAMWTGVAMEVTGALVLFAGGMWDLSTANLLAGTGATCGAPLTCPANNPSGSTTGPTIMMVAGAVGVVAGIPLLVYGAPRVPAAVGKPTATGWAWQF
jgi:hypothetical protein